MMGNFEQQQPALEQKEQVKEVAEQAKQVDALPPEDLAQVVASTQLPDQVPMNSQRKEEKNNSSSSFPPYRLRSFQDPLVPDTLPVVPNREFNNELAKGMQHITSMSYRQTKEFMKDSKRPLGIVSLPNVTKLTNNQLSLLLDPKNHRKKAEEKGDPVGITHVTLGFETLSRQIAQVIVARLNTQASETHAAKLIL